MSNTETEPWYWPEDAASFGDQGWHFSMSLADTKAAARDHGCPERLLGRVADGWHRARDHAIHTEG